MKHKLNLIFFAFDIVHNYYEKDVDIFNIIVTVKLGDLQSASESFERSLDIAKKLNDGPAEAAIKKAMEEVNNRIVQGVKEGDGKDDEDRESVKSDKDRKGATSQASGNPFLISSVLILQVSYLEFFRPSKK